MGKLWPAGGKGFGRGLAGREEQRCFSTKDSSRVPSPKPAVFAGNAPLRNILPELSAHCFPMSSEKLRPVVSPTSGQKEFPGIPASFYRGPLSSLLFRQTLRNPHKWPVRLPGSSCAHVYGSGEGERKRGVYCSQPRALLLLGPLCSQDRAARGFAASPPARCAWWSWQRERPRKRSVSSLPLPYTTASR